MDYRFGSPPCFVTRRLIFPFCFLIVASFGCSSGGNSGSSNRSTPDGVLTGQLTMIPQSRGIFVWGDPVNKLCQQWSIAVFDSSGWFYGTGVSWSSADVYVLEAPNDPLSVVAAENFPYTHDSAVAGVGDTVFFRGRNGFFGAWTITDIVGGHDAELNGVWYFKAGGDGDFTTAIVDGGESAYRTDAADDCTRF